MVSLNTVVRVLHGDVQSAGQVRDAFFSLAADMCAIGPSAGVYAELVRVAQSVWERVRSYEALGWALDLADLLAAAPSPDPGSRRAFVSTVAASAIAFSHRLTRDERALIEAVAVECDVPISLPPTAPSAAIPAGEPWAALSGAVVGLYSLSSGAGPRLAARLAALSPNVRVVFNADTVATDALRNLARHADYLVVDTRHAAHAATGAIDQIRPRERQILPRGGGVSSFLAAVREALE